MSKVYLVVAGSGGGYPLAGWKTRVVCAYEHEEQAQAHVKAAQEAADRNQTLAIGYAEDDETEEEYETGLDPSMSPEDWQEEISYGVETVELYCHFDAYQEAQGIV